MVIFSVIENERFIKQFSLVYMLLNFFQLFEINKMLFIDINYNGVDKFVLSLCFFNFWKNKNIIELLIIYRNYQQFVFE